MIYDIDLQLFAGDDDDDEYSSDSYYDSYDDYGYDGYGYDDSDGSYGVDSEYASSPSDTYYDDYSDYGYSGYGYDDAGDYGVSTQDSEKSPDDYRSDWVSSYMEQSQPSGNYINGYDMNQTLDGGKTEYERNQEAAQASNSGRSSSSDSSGGYSSQSQQKPAQQNTTDAYIQAYMKQMQQQMTQQQQIYQETLAQQKAQQDAITKMLQDQLNAQKQAQVDFNSYISGWSPDMSSQQYVDLAGNATQAAENTKYDNNIAVLKNKLSNVLAQLNGRLTVLPNEYKDEYANNEQSKYNALESVKSILAKRGLLNSGVDVGNQMQQTNKYDTLRQGIDLDLQGAKNNVNTDITTAKNDYESGVASADMERSNIVAQNKAKAAQDYIDYAQKQKQFAADNFWKGADYKLSSDKVNNDLLGQIANYSTNAQQLNQQAQQFQIEISQKASEFATSQGLEYNKLSQQDKQFYDGLAQDQKQFESKAKQASDQFAAQLGLDSAKLKEDGRQFDAKLGYDYESLKSENTRASNQISTQLALAKIDSDTASSKLTEEKRQFDAELKNHTKELDLNTQQFVQKENDRLDKAMYDYLSDYKTADDTQKRSIAVQIVGMINSSNLPESIKEGKLIEIQTVFNIKKK